MLRATGELAHPSVIDQSHAPGSPVASRERRPVRRAPGRWRCRTLILASGVTALLAYPTVGAHAPLRVPRQTGSQQTSGRLGELREEADGLATQSRLLLRELRELEAERERSVEDLLRTGTELDETAEALEDSHQRIVALEATAAAQRPEIQTRLLALYKLGHAGYTRLLFNAKNLHRVGRAYRTVSQLARRDHERLAEHEATLVDLRSTHAALERRETQMKELLEQAQRAQESLDRAVAAQNRLIRQVDARRDLNARMAGELELARSRLQASLDAVAAGGARPGAGVAPPLRLFRGNLEWPVVGDVRSGFGEPRSDGAPGVTRNGIEIAAEPGVTVRAVHEGEVGFAGEFAGFGNLVVVDHGGQAYTLYGHLDSLEVARGDRVDRHAPIGQVGRSPADGATLYFEIRIDDTPVNPLEWLRN